MKQERARRTREQVLDAAAEEFAARGFAQTTLDAVVSRTGMSKGALYGHFASKEDLARALIAYAESAWRTLLVRADQPQLPPLRALRLLTVGLTEQLRADTRIRAALRLAAELPPGGEGEGLPLGTIPQRMVQLAGRAQSASAVAPAHTPTAVAQLLLTTVLGMQALPGLRLDVELPSDIEELWELLALAIQGGRPAAEAVRPPADLTVR